MILPVYFFTFSTPYTSSDRIPSKESNYALIGKFQHFIHDSCKYHKKPFHRVERSLFNLNPLPNDDAFFWIMEIFRNFFMAYDIQEGGYPDTANEHNDHNDNFTGIAEVRRNSHRKAD